MWKLINISAQNICAFKRLNYELLQNKTTLVFGNNLDNDSQQSNGSGKSALIEAIAIALTGSPLRKVNIDEIINDSENEATVSAVLRNSATGEQITVNRLISRKQPQTIQVIKQTGPYDTDCEEISQASVADYNKYILDTIGLSKDDIYNNFILSKHKYASFLSSSDKDKKEIINRFSNGAIVDEAIAAIADDMEPIYQKLNEACATVNTYNGKLSAYDEQIASAENDIEQRREDRSRRIREWEEAIASKRADIRAINVGIEEEKNRIKVIDELSKELEELENSDLVLEGAYKQVQASFASNNLSPVSNYELEIDKLQKHIASLDVNAKSNEVALQCKTVEDLKQEWITADDKWQNAVQSNAAQKKQLDNDYDTLTNSINELQDNAKKLAAQQVQVRRSITRIQQQLAGTIQCPKCRHEFVLDLDLDIEGKRAELALQKKEADRLEVDIESIDSQIADRHNQRASISDQQSKLGWQEVDLNTAARMAEQSYQSADRKLRELQRQVSDITEDIKSTQAKIVNLRTRMFDEVFDAIDAEINRCERQIKSYEVGIETSEGTIKTYQESINAAQNTSDSSLIDNLKEKRKECQELQLSAIKEQEDYQKQYNDLAQQETVFVEFKTHLANLKIKSLANKINEFLEKIGSDIRVALSGYTVLKSGKIRDKISVSLLRDGVDCGSFDKFSEGEKARVNLANILAMHDLTNTSCDDGKGLNLLVLDEILDATDESGLANIFSSLNNLQITSIVVSHGNIAENYPHRLVVNKQHGVSFI